MHYKLFCLKPFESKRKQSLSTIKNNSLELCIGKWIKEAHYFKDYLKQESLDSNLKIFSSLFCYILVKEKIIRLGFGNCYKKLSSKSKEQ